MEQERVAGSFGEAFFNYSLWVAVTFSQAKKCIFFSVPTIKSKRKETARIHVASSQTQ